MKVQLLAPLGVEESNRNGVLRMAPQTFMQPLHRIIQLVRSQRCPVLGKTLLTNAPSQVIASAIHRHVSVAVLALLQCAFDILLES